MLWAMFLLPVAAGVAFFVLHSSQALQNRAQQDLRAALRMQQQHVEYWMDERVRDVGYIAADPRVLSLPPAALRDMLSALLKDSPAFVDLVYVNEHGRTVVDPVHEPGVDVSDRAYFRAARNGESHVTDALISRATGRQTVFVSSPVRDAQGRFRGLVFGSIRLDTVLRFMQTMHAETASRTFVLKADGTLLSPPAPLEKPGSTPLRSLRPGDAIFDHAQARTEPHGIYRNHDGTRVVGTYAWILGGRWLLVGETPEQDILALHAGILGVPLAGAALLFLLFGPMALQLARSLDVPLRRLVEHSNKIESGDFEVQCNPEPQPGDPEEVRRLNVAYCLMVERVRDTLDALRQASLTDPLTGAPNRKLLLQEGPRLIESAQRAGLPVSLLMLDLDLFKNVNDTWGHAAGDTVLKAFAGVLSHRVRQSDIFARVGGEEFAVLAPHAGQKEALELGERIRRTVEELSIPVEVEGQDGAELRITVSVGVGTLPAESLRHNAMDRLMACADKALYRAKNAGRNMVLSCDAAALPEVLPGLGDRRADEQG